MPIVTQEQRTIASRLLKSIELHCVGNFITKQSAANFLANLVVVIHESRNGMSLSEITIRLGETEHLTANCLSSNLFVLSDGRYFLSDLSRSLL